MFSHILLYLIICSLSLCRCYIHIIKFNRDINVIIRLLFQLGQKNYRLDMRRKFLLILNSETITFCENVCITIRGIAFTPSNQLSYTTSFSPNHSAFKREAKSVPYVPDSNRLSSPSFLYLRL